MSISNDSKIYYKYRNFDNLDYTLDIFNNNCLYASSFQKLNDPMDSFFSHYSSILTLLQLFYLQHLNYLIKRKKKK